jgi:hypothetical protein
MLEAVTIPHRGRQLKVLLLNRLACFVVTA